LIRVRWNWSGKAARRWLPVISRVRVTRLRLRWRWIRATATPISSSPRSRARTACRLYREALSLEPNDTAALRGQGEAMVAKGAMERAKENLAKIEKLCAKVCTDATQLSAAIAKGPPVTTAQAEAVPAPSATPTAKP
jgi:hypothetical protein